MAPEVSGSAQIRFRETNQSASIYGVTESYLDVVEVPLSEFRGPGKIAPSQLQLRDEPAFEVLHWPAADTNQQPSDTSQYLAVANDGAVVTSKGGACLWQLGPGGVESLALDVERS